MALHGFDPARFLKQHWQRRPLLLRQALPGFASPIDGNDLAALALQPQVQARLVQRSSRARWQLRHGPFAEADFATLPPRDWTLLVQDVDKWLPQAVGALLGHFDFLPSWRLEDIMVSYAVPGGSVGAHVDQYDVFLLQAAGRREWQIDDTPAPPLALDPAAPLKLLQHFRPNRSWVLEPGDLLYLPPGVPHHGIAVDDCLTFSIGLRAPAAIELLQGVAADLLEHADDSRRYRDPPLPPAPRSGEIDAAALGRLRAELRQALAGAAPLLDAALGRVLCRYRAPRPLQPPARPLRPDTLAARLQRGQVLRPDPWQRLAWTRDPQHGAAAEVQLHCSEASVALPAELAERLCRGGRLDAAAWLAAPETARAGLWRLYALGALQLARPGRPEHLP